MKKLIKKQCETLSIIHQNNIFNDLLTLEQDYPDIILHMFTMMALLDQKGFAINYRYPNSPEEIKTFLLQMRILFRHFYPKESMVIKVGWPWWQVIFEFWRSPHEIADWLFFFKDEVLISKGWVTREYMENLFKTVLLMGEGDLKKGMDVYERYPEDDDKAITVTVTTTNDEPPPSKRRRKLLEQEHERESVLQCIRDVFASYRCSVDTIHKILDELKSTKQLSAKNYHLLKAEYLEQEDDM
jgi:hypothetical protein